MSGTVVIAEARPELDPWRALGFDELWDRLSGEVVDRNRLRRVERLETPAGPAFLKRFEGVQLKNWWKLAVVTAPQVRSQAAREVRVADALRRKGFGVPELLAWGEDVGVLAERRSFVLWSALPGRPLAALPDGGPDAALLLEVARACGRQVFEGPFLPDLGLDHVFVGDDAGLAFIDLHNARTAPPPRPRELGRALVRFFRSPGGAEALRRVGFEPFARAYLEAADRTEALPRALALARARLGVPGLDSSGRYEEGGKAAAFATRNPARDRAERELLRHLLVEAGLAGRLGRTLDAACGAGRLRPLVEDLGGSWVGVDRSAAMLAEAGTRAGRALVRAGVEALPFADRSFDTVLCLRLLHHLGPDGQREVVGELGRVAGRALVVSAFHPWSIHGWSRAVEGRLRGRPRGRHATSPRRLAAWLPDFVEAGRVRQGPLRDLYLCAFRRVAGRGDGAHRDPS